MFAVLFFVLCAVVFLAWVAADLVRGVETYSDDVIVADRFGNTLPVDPF